MMAADSDSDLDPGAASPPRSTSEFISPIDRGSARLGSRRREPIASDVLFAGATEIEIAHRGVLYRLRKTALGKLILTK